MDADTGTVIVYRRTNPGDFRTPLIFDDVQLCRWCAVEGTASTVLMIQGPNYAASFPADVIEHVNFEVDS